MNLDILKEYPGYISESFQIETAPDGLIAWQMLNDNKSAYDIVILDNMMPMLTGIEILTKMQGHAELKYIPVVIQPARAGKEDVIQGY